MSVDLEREQDLLEEFEDGAGVGGDGNDPVLRGVKRRRGVAQRGGTEHHPFRISFIEQSGQDLWRGRIPVIRFWLWVRPLALR